MSTATTTPAGISTILSNDVSTRNLTATVQAIYEAFGRGDVATILTHTADNVDWNNSNVASAVCPWNGNFSGKANIHRFFEAVGANLEFRVFNPHTFIESGNHVAVLLRLESNLKKNGTQLENDSVHIFRFNDLGQVDQYRHYNDTAQELAAWNR